MTVTQYVTQVPNEILVDECREMLEQNTTDISTFVNRLITRNPYAEEDGADLSSLIPRMQAKFDAAMREASFLAHYDKTLKWSGDNG